MLTDIPRVHVLHENPDWIGPIADALEAAGVPWSEWLMLDAELDLDEPPPPGIFWSRMSASAHTRGHGRSKDQTRATLAWLEAHGRRVVNGRRVLELEMSKVDQLACLKAAGFDVPRTIAVTGRAGLLAAAKRLPTPFVSKHNQGGKGLGVVRYDTHAAFVQDIDTRDQPVDGITLLQEYVEPAGLFITRVEIVGGRFLYALTADTGRGGFQLCPADACAIDADSCLADGTPAGSESLFALRTDFDDPIIERYEQFAEQLGVEIAAFEFIETADGRKVTYDINTNTNYNPDVDAAAPRSGPAEVATYLGKLLTEAHV
ncbi:MAG: glutathione synthase [Mycobacteriales bacterium]